MKLSEEHLVKIQRVFDNAVKFTAIKGPSEKALSGLSMSTNYLFVLASGTLLWSINNYQLFYIEDGLYHKAQYLSFLICFLISVLMFALFRISLFFNEYAKNVIKDGLYSSFREIEIMHKNMSEEELQQKVETGLREYLEKYNLIVSVFKIRLSVYVSGLILYVFGLLDLVVYVSLYFNCVVK